MNLHLTDDELTAEEAFLKTCDGDPETFEGATITMDAVLNALKFKNDEKAHDDYRHDGGYNECKCTV